jgi:hypothetical protein
MTSATILAGTQHGLHGCGGEVKAKTYARSTGPRQSPAVGFPPLPGVVLRSDEVRVMQRRKQAPAPISPPHRTSARTEVEERRRVIVALLRQHPDGLTAREIGEATGVSKNLTASALSGLFTRGVLHKHGHRYVLAAQEGV